MEVIPAIDIKGERCVRLFQGDYSQETVFSPDPVAIALKWQSMGTKKLHIVDLDGAIQGKPVNLRIVQRIAREVKIPIQLGGGFRGLKEIQQALDIGANQVIIGTMAVKDVGMVKEAYKLFGEAIMVSLDAKDGKIAIEGWQERTGIDALELLTQMTEIGIKHFIYTDIARDGTLTQPNFPAIRHLLAHTTLPLLVSGGISSLDHLKELAHIGVKGAIIGKALYTGAINLKEAITAFL